jgi:hypothetical protein
VGNIVFNWLHNIVSGVVLIVPFGVGFSSGATQMRATSPSKSLTPKIDRTKACREKDLTKAYNPTCKPVARANHPNIMSSWHNSRRVCALH